MPEGNPRYRDLPRSESIAYFEDGTRSHGAVRLVTKLNEKEYFIQRWHKSDLYVYLTNIYIVSVADVHEIKMKFPNVQCIVTISNWNSYSPDARSFCESQKIGLFRYQEYYGALNYDNDRFYNYQPPSDNK